MTHGLFTVYLGAIDDQGNDNNISITVRIEKQIIWSDQSTDDPREMNIDTQHRIVNANLRNSFKLNQLL